MGRQNNELTFFLDEINKLVETNELTLNMSYCENKILPLSCVQEFTFKDESSQILKAKESGVTYIYLVDIPMQRQKKIILQSKDIIRNRCCLCFSISSRDPDIVLDVAYTYFFC